MASKGILGVKLGMTQVFDDEHRVVPVTVVQAGPCTVTQVKTPETDGYTAVQLAYGTKKHVNKPLAGHLAKAGIDTAKVLVEVRLDDGDEVTEVGSTVTVDAFTAGEVIDVTGTSKGKGYAGVMKRHNFRGLGDGHGVKKKNRHPGAVGACATPGRTFPGQRMPGRTGNEQVTIQNLEIVDVDTERNLLLVKGAVPGHDGSVVVIRSAVKGPEVPGLSESLAAVQTDEPDEVEVDEETTGQEAAAEPEASAEAEPAAEAGAEPEDADEDEGGDA